MRTRCVRRPGVAHAASAGAALLGLTAMTSAIASAQGEDIELVLGGTGPCCVTPSTPGGVPGPPYTTVADQLFTAHYFPGYTPQGLPTPEQFAPFTGIASLPLDQSVSQDVTDIDAAVTAQLANGNDVIVLGASQSASAATVYQDELAALPVSARPSPDQLSFVLLGDPDNPDGGLLERIAGVYVPDLGLQAYGPTPDDLYPSVIYTAQYDGFADFPQYPLDLPADFNALFGVEYVHPFYTDLTAAQIAAGVVEPVTAADTDTTYIMIPTQTLPLLKPFAGLLPAPLMDLIEPPLRYIINLGYDPTAPANVPAPAQLLPDINPISALIGFGQSIGQGINDALGAVGLPSLPDIPALSNLVNDVANSPLATTTFTAADLTFPVPAQIGDVIDGPLNALDSGLTAGINDGIDPAIQSTVYGVGDALRAAATDAGAPEKVTNAIYVLEQLLPIEFEAPGDAVTNSAHLLVTGIEDLAAGNLSEFGAMLQSIVADNIVLTNFEGFFALDAVLNIAAGVPLG
uniref:PE-PPE domain-containing protein n=1 Tax=Mycobacterium sp. TaxID=1785 RepID=UPI0031DD7FB0